MTGIGTAGYRAVMKDKSEKRGAQASFGQSQGVGVGKVLAEATTQLAPLTWLAQTSWWRRTRSTVCVKCPAT